MRIIAFIQDAGINDKKVFGIYSVQLPALIQSEGRNIDGVIYSYPDIPMNQNAAEYFATLAAKMLDAEVKQVKRNSERFPADFLLQLTETEANEVVAKCDHLKKLKFSSTLPLAFTEHGAIMAATVLNSRVAIETSILVVRAFIHAREIISEHRELKLRLERLEERVARGFHDTEDELQAVRFAIQQLMDLPPPSSKKTDWIR